MSKTTPPRTASLDCAGRRPRWTLVFVTLVALSLAACGGGDEKKPAPTPPTPAGTSTKSPPPAGKAPEKLSELALFSDVKTLTPADGVLTYSVRNPRWHDGTDQVRHALLPAGGKIEVDEDGEFIFPEGTLLAWTCFTKDGNPEGRSHPRIETRVSRRLAKKRRWEQSNYAWNAAGDDADLVPYRTGSTADFKLPGVETPYEYVGRTQCVQCHNGGKDLVLGMNAWQLDDGTLAKLTELGHLSAERPLPHQEIKGDSPLESEFLGYLAGNCSFCHVPLSASFMQNHLDLQHWKAKKSLVGVAGTRFTSPDAPCLVTAGDPDKSMIVKLFNRTYAEHDPNRRMPPIGNALVDPRGLKLITEWIQSLK